MTTPAASSPGVATPAEAMRPECRHWIGAERHHCRAGDGVRVYLPGPRCPAHTPAALQGKAEPQPGPGWPIFHKDAS